VVAFALISDVLRPKAFSGLFSAAPSVALASLGLTAAMMGPAKAAESALPMVAGAIGLIVFCIVAALLEKKTGAITGSAVAWLSWAVAAGIAFWALFL
jgi:uncharacterized protein DUF3147